MKLTYRYKKVTTKEAVPRVIHVVGVSIVKE
jgi:hypothetical protein